MNVAPSNAYTRLPFLFSVVWLTGCAGVDLSQFDIRQAASGTPSGFSFTSDSAAKPQEQTRSMIGSELDGLLKKYPITNSQRPETWPRVAITVVHAPPSVFKTAGIFGSGTIAASDCVSYKVRVWTDARNGTSYDDLRMCYGELYQRLQGIPMYQVPTWGRREFWRGERNTGSVRGDGPIPPLDHFPSDPQLQNLWLDPYKNTLAFVAGPLAVLGFNWNDVNDKRVWFVSVPSN